DYVRLVDVPLGATAEVMTFESLIRCSKLIDPAISEYLMLFLFEPKNFRCGVIKPFASDYSSISLTVDLPSDLARTRKIVEKWPGPTREIRLNDIVDIITKFQISSTEMRSTGLVKLPYGRSIDFQDFQKDMNRRVEESTKRVLYE
ncbi:MAG: hypothetical protein DI538_29105, partial [Azospira oryzae]